MPSASLAERLQRRVRASKHDDDEEDLPETSPDGELAAVTDDSEGSEREENPVQSGEDHDGSGDASDEPGSDSDEDATAPDPAASISFGALARAQASLNQSLKRKRPADPVRRSPSPFHEADERSKGKRIPGTETRSSKHAPTEQSSKRAVSRKRTIIPPANAQSRDPRFSNLSGRLDPQKVRANYDFLDAYRRDELASLKARLKQAKDEGERDLLKRNIRSYESREQARQREEAEREVKREHWKAQREAVAQGKKPFFLKKGEIKKQVLVKKFKGMSEKKAEKLMERRRKKKAGKEKRLIPKERRGIGEEG